MDVDDVVVINYDSPVGLSEYIQRIGYCQRHKFTLMSFITITNDMEFFKLQDYYSIVIGCIPQEQKKKFFGTVEF